MISHTLKGYTLLEVLMAIFIVNLIITLGFRYQVQTLKQSAQQFQELWAINQLDNLLERLSANPLTKEQEFQLWSLENNNLIPEARGSYHCNFTEQCEVSLEWNHEKFQLNST